MQSCSELPPQNQTSSYAMDHWDWPGKQWRAERQACHCTRLTACFSQTVKPFWRLIFIYILFFSNVSFLFQNSTLYRQNRNLCWHIVFSQNCCFVASFVDKALVDDSTTDYDCCETIQPSKSALSIDLFAFLKFMREHSILNLDVPMSSWTMINVGSNLNKFFFCHLY